MKTKSTQLETSPTDDDLKKDKHFNGTLKKMLKTPPKPKTTKNNK